MQCAYAQTNSRERQYHFPSHPHQVHLSRYSALRPRKVPTTTPPTWQISHFPRELIDAFREHVSTAPRGSTTTARTSEQTPWLVLQFHPALYRSGFAAKIQRFLHHPVWHGILLPSGLKKSRDPASHGETPAQQSTSVFSGGTRSNNPSDERT